jgi:hypothetical protein
MKLIWKEHRCACRKKKTDTSIASVTATDVLVEHLAGLKVATFRELDKVGALRYIPFVHW